MEMSDEELIKIIVEGDREKFGEIIERYQEKIFGYLKNLTNQSNEEIEDLMAEVFINGYTNLQSFDTKKKFSSWIFRIAHNRAIDFFKKRKIKTKTMEESEEMIGDGKKIFEEIEIEKEERKRVNQAVEKLEIKYREVILLYFYDERSYEEISDILHIPTSNVGVLLYRAKDKLKKLL